MDYNGIEIQKLNHAAFKIKTNKVIVIDPFRINNQDEKADYLLITHEHSDHCSLEDVKKCISENTIIITVADCVSKVSSLQVQDVKIVEPGMKLEFEDMLIEVVDAYNVNKFRSPGLPFHPKANSWVGFIINYHGTRIYHTGDTDVIQEMNNINNIDVALLPVSGTYVMTAEEAAQAVDIIKPKIAVPMHYGVIVGSEEDAQKFKRLAKCQVEIL